MARLIIFFLTLFLLACSSSTADDTPAANTSPVTSPTPSPTAKPTVEEVVVADIRKATWKPIFFEAIDERTDLAGIGRLREERLKEDDIEVRVWGGFGKTALEGFVLSRKIAQWTALRLDFDFESRQRGPRTVRLKEPKIGWDQMWQELLERGLLTLPDAESINCDVNGLDGYSYVVEIKKGENYRTYMYDNPDGRCVESEKMIRIARIIDEQFDLDQYRPTSRR